MNFSDTIAAPATGSGGAITIIRLSGKDALHICDSIFRAASGKNLREAEGYTIHYGTIRNGNETIDEVLVSVFRSPRSYTGEDMIEISCHASAYIQSTILDLLINSGARMADPGEFTLRAFTAGKMDLSQAEAVASVIAAGSKAEHSVAINQLRGGYSVDFRVLRGELLRLLSLIELELDFGEEDVSFADRNQLREIMQDSSLKIRELAESFKLGNAIKEGIAVAIAGEPNVGKSTLLNALLNEDRAMVSDIAGTTRDSIEESLVIDGVKYRFIDTAGMRETDDSLEKMGIERTLASISKADTVIYMATAELSPDNVLRGIKEAIPGLNLREDQKLLVLVNKIDKAEAGWKEKFKGLSENEKPGWELYPDNILLISSKTGENLIAVKEFFEREFSGKLDPAVNTIVSNRRHYEALLKADAALSKANGGLESLPTDLLAEEIKDVTRHLAVVTGEITSENVLQNIFGEFCIGK